MNKKDALVRLEKLTKEIKDLREELLDEKDDLSYEHYEHSFECARIEKKMTRLDERIAKKEYQLELIAIAKQEIEETYKNEEEIKEKEYLLLDISIEE